MRPAMSAHSATQRKKREQEGHMRLLLIVLLFSWYTQALADTVVPSDRVVNAVNVRPTPSSPTVISQVHPGESVTYLGEEGHWYHIQLSDGREGYVHKAWTRVIPATASTTLELHFIDVGQGDSTLIVCPDGETILIDAGSSSGSAVDPIRDYLLAQLDRRERRIDHLIITHPDIDHYNLLPEVLREVPVGHVYRVGELTDYTTAFQHWLDAIPASRTTIYQATDYDPQNQANAQMDCGAADVYLLAAAIPATKSRKNAMSVVLMVRDGQFEAVLTGDATTDTEDAILARYPASWLDSDVLKVGHHGSLATSTSPTWVQTLSPETAVISAGTRNRYGHPRQEILARLAPYTASADPHPTSSATHEQSVYKWHEQRDYDEAIYLTATNGNIVVTATGQNYQLQVVRHAP